MQSGYYSDCASSIQHSHDSDDDKIRNQHQDAVVRRLSPLLMFPSEAALATSTATTAAEEVALFQVDNEPVDDQEHELKRSCRYNDSHGILFSTEDRSKTVGRWEEKNSEKEDRRYETKHSMQKKEVTHHDNEVVSGGSFSNNHSQLCVPSARRQRHHCYFNADDIYHITDSSNNIISDLNNYSSFSINRHCQPSEKINWNSLNYTIALNSNNVFLPRHHHSSFHQRQSNDFKNNNLFRVQHDLQSFSLLAQNQYENKVIENAKRIGAGPGEATADENRIFVIATGWIAQGMEATAELAGKLRVVTVLQQPGALWSEQGIRYFDEDEATKESTKDTFHMLETPIISPPQNSRMRVLHAACWQNLELPRSFYLSPSTTKWYNDTLDLMVPHSIEIGQYRRVFGDQYTTMTKGFCSVSQAKETGSKTKPAQHHVTSPTFLRYDMPFSDPQYVQKFHNSFCIIFKIYPDPNQIEEMKQLLFYAEMSALEYRSNNTCLRYETLKASTSQSLDESLLFVIYGIYTSQDHFYQHLLSMGTASLLGERLKELSVQHPIILQFKGDSIHGSS